MNELKLSLSQVHLNSTLTVDSPDLMDMNVCKVEYEQNDDGNEICSANDMTFLDKGDSNTLNKEIKVEQEESGHDFFDFIATTDTLVCYILISCLSRNPAT